MRRRIVYAILLLLCFPALEMELEARRGGGFSRSFGRSFGRSSFGSRSSRSGGRYTWGSRSSGYKRKGGLFGKSSRSSRGRSFSNRKTLAPRRTHNSNGRKLLSSSYAKKSSRTARRDNFRQQYERPRTMFNPSYYGGRPWGSWGWGMGSVGVWDLFFLSTVNHMFWYHHWHSPGLQSALYHDNLLQKEELRRLETRLKELEQQGVKRNPNYLPEGVDPDVAHSKEYVENHEGEIYQSPESNGQTKNDGTSSDSGGGLTTLAFLFSLGLFFYMGFIRKY